MSQNHVTSTHGSFAVAKYLLPAICGLMTLLFAGFAYLQINDATQYGNQDAWLWILLYGIMAVLSGFVAYAALESGVLLAWGGFCWGCLLFKIQDQHGNLQLAWLRADAYLSPESGQMLQQANESGGLFILACMATLLIFINRYLRKNRSKPATS